jgi:cytochrome c oxidase subunit 4
MTLAEYRKRRPAPEEPAEHKAKERGHPGPLEYAVIGLVLAGITAIEVAVYYFDIAHDLLVAVLLGLSALKFSLVVMWFMHLRFDSGLFTQMFVLGFLLALSIFFVALATLGGALV